jgi:two-component system, NarL family, response regulator NreC
VTKIRVLIADDHAVLQAGLEAMLNAEADMAVVGSVSEGTDVVREAMALLPDVVLLDINMPGMNGLEALAELRAAIPHIRVLILTMHDDAQYLRQAMAAGAAGYVLKQAAGKELLSAIRTVHGGGVYLHPAHARTLATPPLASTEPKPEDASAAQALYNSLSEREAEVFSLVALGYRNSEIADKLALSVKTVETYKSRMMEKLGIHTRASLVRIALELGILDSDSAGADV